MCISNLGTKKFVDCDNSQEFMNVLSFIRDIVDEDEIAYADLAVCQ
jgi:hypothetical protein